MPAEIETRYVAEPDAPLRRDWRDDVKFDFQAGVRRVTRFASGLGVVGWGWLSWPPPL